MPRILDAFLRCIFICLMVSACATSGNRVSSIPSELQAKSIQNSSNFEDPIVITIKWPLSVDQSVRARFIRNADEYHKIVFGLPIESDETQTVPEFTTIASMYYAAEMFAALSRKLPNAIIILEPVVVTRDNSGTIVAKAITPPNIPSTFDVDIVDLQTNYLPFLSTVLTFSLRTQPSIFPENCGILIAMKYQFNPSLYLKEKTTCANKTLDSIPTPLWYLGFNSPSAESSPFPTKTALPLRKDVTLIYPPVLLFSMHLFGAITPDYVVQSRPETLNDVATMVLHPHIVNMADIISTAPALLPSQKPPATTLSRYASSFDQNLAAALERSDPLNERQQKNVALIVKLMNTELKIRSKRDWETVRWILGGEYGKSFREVRDNSYDGFNTMMLKSWASALTLSAITPLAGSPMGILSRNMTIINQHVSAMNIVGDQLHKQFVPALDSLDQEYIQLEGRRIALGKAAQAEIQKSLIAIYAKYKK